MLPPVSAAEIVARTQAAFKLFLTFDEKQLERFGDEMSDAVKSFWAPILVLPLSLWITLMRDAGTVVDQAPLLPRLITELSAYAIDVVYWPLAMVMIADLLQKPESYARYISAYNWTVIPITVIATGLAAVFGVTDGTMGLPGVALMFWILLFRIRLARKIFDLNVGVAVALVAGDFFLGLLVSAMRAGVLVG
ncbi:MAG: hypothetical protein RIB45_03365 [Marivibrio sp.]|uniref:hypothetical protein n=1 Tax=Marivibrio sp. TaxID=2039719 RepID=UPI0032ECC8FF